MAKDIIRNFTCGYIWLFSEWFGEKMRVSFDLCIWYNNNIGLIIYR